MKRLLLLAVFLAITTDLSIAASSGAADMHAARTLKTQREPSDIEGVDWIASYEIGPLRAVYQAETACGAPLGDPYVIDRDADRGLVVLKDQHDRRVKRYAVPGARIRAIVHVKYDMAVLDRADLVFTDVPGQNIVLIHTTVENAGIFTSSDVYPLAYRRGKVVDSYHLIKDPSLAKMVEIGASLYREMARRVH
ncbi:hypothetical protein [Paraburkholderia sp. DGU8]|uniref:hypothetical protein n=1 Tax=Paraburkholderia sp. DGU8 TaxID=3161997 RepID=UPI003466860F